MSTVRVGLECAALAALVWAALFVIGWPVWSLLAGRGPRLSATTGAPLTGLAVTEVAGWYWNGHFSLDPLAYGLLGAGAAGSAVFVLRRRSWRHVDRASLGRGVPFLGLAGAVAALFTIDHQRVFRLGHLSTGILQQPDLPNYVLWSDHLRSATFADAGHIAGFHLGHAVTETTAGTFTFLGSAAAWLDRPTWEASLPVALVSVFLIACASRDLAKVFLGRDESISTLIGLAAVVGSVFVYAVAFYSLSQLVGMAGMVGVTVVLARTARSATRARVVRGVLEALPPAIVVLLSYPHMALLSAPLVAGTAVAAAWGTGWRPRVANVTVATTGVVAGCVVLLPGRAAHAFDYLRLTGEAVGNPFPFPLLTPVAFLGLQGDFSYRAVTSDALFALQTAALVVIFGAAFLWARGRMRGGLAAATVATAGAFASYLLLYVVRGASYAAWKWAAFFVPLFAVGLLATLAALVLANRAKIPNARWLVAGTLALIVAGQGIAAFSATNEYDSVLAGASRPTPWLVVDEPLESIADGSAWSGVRSVDVDLPTLWESTWASYFVKPRRVVMRAGGSNPSPEPPPAIPSRRWRLESALDPGANPPRSEMRKVNDRYLLIRDDADGYRNGDLWIVGRCAGIYRFDGRRWRGVERTTGSGHFDLAATPEPRPAGTRAPLLIRQSRATRARDSLLLQYLADGRARLLFDHKLYGKGPRRASKSFPLPRGQTTPIDVVMDPITGEVNARVAGRTVLDTHVRFFRARHGVTIVGLNRLGLFADALERFPGQISSLPQPRPGCTSVSANAEG